jgi:predicted DNA-binding protein YlxM (UPF0122 family)
MLTQLYVHDRLSMDEIAARFGCSRQAVHKKLRAWGIPRRTRQESRNLTLAQGKIHFTVLDKHGQIKTVSHQHEHVHEAFFETWTLAMAWVLGVIATDHPGLLGWRRQRLSLRRRGGVMSHD